MSLLAAGKCCVDCGKTADPESKSSIREYMFNHFSAVFNNCVEQVDLGICNENDLNSLNFFIKQLEIECFRCNGTSMSVFRKIDSDHVKLLEKEMEEVIKKSEEYGKTQKKAKRSRKKKGKVIYIRK